MRNLWELLHRTGGLRRFILMILLRCPFDALLTVIQASFLKFAFEAINQGNPKKLGFVCAIFGIGSFFLFLYNGTVWTAYAVFVTKWVGTIRRKLIEHISCLSMEQIDARPSGDWITRLNADVQAASAMLNQPIHLPHTAVSIVNICVSAGMLVLMNPAIFGLIILFVVPHMLISQLFIANPMTRFAMNVQEATAENTTDMNTLVTCAEIAVVYDAQRFLLRRFEESSLQLRKENMKMQHRRAMGSGLLPLMGMSGYLVLLLIGGGWMAAGAMTFGELVAAFQYRGGILVGSMMLLNSLMNIKTALAGVNRVNETMCIPLEE